MAPVDAMYLYTLGYSVHPLADVKEGDRMQQWLLPLYIAQTPLEQFLSGSVYQPKLCSASGYKLLAAIRNLTNNYVSDLIFEFLQAYTLSSALAKFEHVLTAEFGQTSLFLIQKVRGFDTSDLVQNGSVIFAPDLIIKVPEAKADIEQATRCIAFDLPTAAGFHLHRANESIMHRWYDVVTSNAPRPKGRNIGDYLVEMDRLGVGDQKVKSALKDLKDLHRNPLIHPDQSLNSIDEAIGLLGSIQAVANIMIKEIPTPATPGLAGSALTVAHQS